MKKGFRVPHYSVTITDLTNTIAIFYTICKLGLEIGFQKLVPSLLQCVLGTYLRLSGLHKCFCPLNHLVSPHLYDKEKQQQQKGGGKNIQGSHKF